MGQAPLVTFKGQTLASQGIGPGEPGPEKKRSLNNDFYIRNSCNFMNGMGSMLNLCYSRLTLKKAKAFNLIKKS
jgi:hypothetical protein